MDVLTLYKNRKSRAEEYCYPHWSRAIDNYKHYLGRLDVSGLSNEDDYPFSSRMSTSISYEIVETVMPRLIGKNPEFTTIAIEPQDAPYEATAKLAIDYEYNNPKLALKGEPIYLKLQKNTKEALITGNSVLRAFWRRESVKRYQYYGKIEQTGKEGEYREIIKAAERLAESSGKKPRVRVTKKLVDNPFLDDFDVKHVPFFFFYPDAEMVEPGRMRFMIERSYATFEQLVDEAEFFGYEKSVLNDIKKMIEENRHGFTPEINKNFLYEYRQLFKDSLTSRSFSTDDDKIPLLIVDKMWEGNRVHVIVNEKYVLTGDGVPNPYDVQTNPFIFTHDVLIPHSYFARSEIDAIKRVEDGLNDMMNMRMDNLIQSMLNIWLINPQYFEDPEEFSPIPNSIFPVRDVERAVRPLQGNDVTAGVYRESQELYQFIQRITGVNDYVKGVEGEKIAGRTYGGLRLVQEAANARFIVKSRLFETTTLASLGYFILELSRQFINKDRRVRMFGEQDKEFIDKTIKASDLKSIKGYMDIKVIPNSSRAIDEQAEAIKLNNLYDRMVSGSGPFKDMPPELWDAFLVKWLPLYGIHDAIYWVRAMREARNSGGGNKEAQPPQAKIPVQTGNQVIQSDQVAGNQPNPLEELIKAGV